MNIISSIKFKKQKKIVLFLALFVIAGFFLLWPQQSLAGEFLDAIGSAIAWIFAQLNYVLGVYILLPLINFMAEILQYNNFLGSYAVQIGWPLVRDLTNMFLVVILLIIAFSTILHISTYHYRNILLKLVIMALLINFSKLILGFMIDFAQVIMLTFVDAFRSAAVSALSYVFGITKVGEVMVDYTQTGYLEREDIFGTAVLNFIFLIVAIAVILVYVAVILWRILNLWILVILSPFAFLAVAFPALRKYSSDFWSRFWNQLTIGVILSFCLWLAFMLMAAGVIMEGGESLTQELVGEVGGENKQLWEQIYIFIISIALLLLGLQYAQQAGGFAGAFAGKVGGKLSELGTKATKAIARAPFKAAKFGINEGIDKLAQKTGVDLNMKRNWQRLKDARADRKAKQMSDITRRSGRAMREGGFIGSRLAAMTGGLRDHYTTYGLWRGLGKITPFARMGQAARNRSEKLKDQGDAEEEIARQQEDLAKYKGSSNLYVGTRMPALLAERNQLEARKTELEEKVSRGTATADEQAEYTDITDKLSNLKLEEEVLRPHIAVQDIDFSAADEELDAFLQNFKRRFDDVVGDLGGLAVQEADLRAQLTTTTDPEKREKIDKSLQEVLAQKKRLEGEKNATDEARAIFGIDSYDGETSMNPVKLAAIRDNVEHERNTSLPPMAAVYRTRRLSEISSQRMALLAGRSRNDLSPEEKREIKELDMEEGDLTLQQGTMSYLSEDEQEELRKESAQHREEASKLKKKSAQVAPLAGYEAQQATRAMEAEEMKKIEHITDYNELITLFREAQSRKDKARTAAILKKLSSDYNENEILNAYGYTSGFKGYQQFFENEVGRKGGFSQQEMLSLAGDVSAINESRGHYNTARTCTMENGQWRWYSEREHVEVSGAEINKRSERDIANKLNRLAYGGEDALGKFVLEANGAFIIRQHTANWVSNERLVLEHFNTNAAQKLLEAERKYGALSTALKGMTTSTGKKLVDEFVKLLNKKLGTTATEIETVSETARMVSDPNFLK